MGLEGMRAPGDRIGRLPWIGTWCLVLSKRRKEGYGR